MEVISNIFFIIFTLITIEIIAARYLLVEVEQIKVVGMFLTLKKVNTNRSLQFSKTCHFVILFLVKSPEKDEIPGDLCACGWYGGWNGGCRIDEPAPPGYKCFCWPVAFIFTCNGKGLKCKSKEELGCNGCKERECCVGNCEGYPKRTWP